jgi:hypothetical protein
MEVNKNGTIVIVPTTGTPSTYARPDDERDDEPNDFNEA